MVDEQVSARQQGVFPPGLLLREDLDGGALLVQPARDVDQVVQAGGSVRGLDLTPAFNSMKVRERKLGIWMDSLIRKAVILLPQNGRVPPDGDGVGHRNAEILVHH